MPLLKTVRTILTRVIELIDLVSEPPKPNPTTPTPPVVNEETLARERQAAEALVKQGRREGRIPKRSRNLRPYEIRRQFLDQLEYIERRHGTDKAVEALQDLATAKNRIRQ